MKPLVEYAANTPSCAFLTVRHVSALGTVAAGLACAPVCEMKHTTLLDCQRIPARFIAI